MTIAELLAPLTKGKRWAKHAAEREQQIQSEAMAIKVLLPDVSDEEIQRCLKENGGKSDLALQHLLDAQEADLLGGLLDDESPPPTRLHREAMPQEQPQQQQQQQQECTAAVPGEPATTDEEAKLALDELDHPLVAEHQVAVREQTEQTTEQRAQTEQTAQNAQPPPASVRALSPPEETPSAPKVPNWLPMLQPATPADLSSKRKIQYDRQTERLKAALGPAPKAVSVTSAHDLDVRGKARDGGG